MAHLRNEGVVAVAGGQAVGQVHQELRGGRLGALQPALQSHLGYPLPVHTGERPERQGMQLPAPRAAPETAKDNDATVKTHTWERKEKSSPTLSRLKV